LTSEDSRHRVIRGGIRAANRKPTELMDRGPLEAEVLLERKP
jgi:hypothetical protein